MSLHFFVPKSPSGQFGQFEGIVQCTWLDIDHPASEANKPERKVKLLQTFAYRDPEGYQWVVPKDKIVDGASIPKIFWKIVGSPYVGNYRRASVIHDYFCCVPEQHQKTAKEVHQMFYFACRAGNTSPFKAALMYWAVYWFGPHWTEDQRYPSLTYYYITGPWRILQRQLCFSREKPTPKDPSEVIQG